MKQSLLKQSLTVSLFLFLCAQTLHATTYTDNGSTATYHLYSGDVLEIRSGTYSGSIETFETGATIKVLSGATFQPVEFTSPKGSLVNIGTSVLAFSGDEGTPLSGFSLDNFGLIKFIGATNTNGAEVWLNRFGATMQFSGLVQLNGDLNFTNNGTIQVDGGDFTINGNTNFLNNNMVDAGQKVTFNGSSHSVNKGTIKTKGEIHYLQGISHINSCRLITESNFKKTVTLHNDGFIWVKGSSAGKTFTNFGPDPLVLLPNSIIKVPDFENYGTVSGTGALYFTGDSYNIGGTVGSSSEPGTISVYEVSRLNPTGTFDYNWGTIHSNVSYTVLPEPPEDYLPTGCADLTLTIPLPLKWNFFQAQAKQNTPVLTWKASFTNIVHFVIERSFDLQTYQQISTITAENNQVYTYSDQAAKPASTVYYRIKAIETTGNVQNSEVRKVNLTSYTSQVLSITPNPFVNTAFLSVHFEKAQKLQLIVRNTNGQPISIQENVVHAGTHKIAITIAPQLPKGVYLIEVKTPNGLIGTSKFIKQ